MPFLICAHTGKHREGTGLDSCAAGKLLYQSITTYQGKVFAVKFADLLKVTQSNHDVEVDHEKLQEAKRQVVNLEEKLQEVKAFVKEQEALLNAPILAAVKAAKELGVEVPDEYSNITTSKKSTSKTSGKYLWTVEGSDYWNKLQASPSRFAYFHTKEAEGSNKGGRFNIKEFDAYIEEALGAPLEELEAGKAYQFELPSKKKAAVERIGKSPEDSEAEAEDSESTPEDSEATAEE